MPDSYRLKSHVGPPLHETWRAPRGCKAFSNRRPPSPLPSSKVGEGRLDWIPLRDHHATVSPAVELCAMGSGAPAPDPAALSSLGLKG